MKRVELNVDFIGGEGRMSIDEEIALTAFIKKRKAKFERMIASGKSKFNFSTKKNQ